MGRRCKGRRHRVLDEFSDWLAGGVFEGVGDLDRTPDGGHVFVRPVNAEGLVDGGEEIPDAGLFLENNRCPLVALPHYLTGLEASATESQ